LSNHADSKDPRKSIIDALRKHPEGLTLKDIADIVGHHRHTITKYVYELIGAQVIHQRDIGAAKLCYLRESYNGNGRDGRKAQAQLVALFMLLLLIPATVIVAQNVTDTGSGIDGMVTSIDTGADAATGDAPSGSPLPDDGAVVPETSDEPVPDPGAADVGTEPSGHVTEEPEENGTLDTVEPPLPEDGTAAADAPNATEGDTQETETNQTDGGEAMIDRIEPENVTSEDTAAVNGTGEDALNGTEPIVPVTDGTSNETNATETAEPPEPPEMNGTVPAENGTVDVINGTDETEQPAEPEVSVSIITPERVTRGEAFEVAAVVENLGAPAGNVVLEWALPDSMEISEGSATDEVGILETGSSHRAEIIVTSGADSSLGPSEIRVRVSYE
jgi:hypothetical protein